MKAVEKSKLIAVVGGSGAGKSWLAGRLQHVFGAQAVRLSQDNFYHDLERQSQRLRAEPNFDHPESIDWPAFVTVLRDCRAGRVVRVPQYDFVTHSRLPEAMELVPAPLLIVDGLWLLWKPQIEELFDLKVFLDCPASLRLEQRLFRDTTERGRTPDSIRAQFLQTVTPMHEEFVEPQARRADIVMMQPVPEGAVHDLARAVHFELLEARAINHDRRTNKPTTTSIPN